jgi:SET domain-containing protein 6
MYHVMGSLLLTRSFTVEDEVKQGVQTRESGRDGVDSVMEEGQDMSQDSESMDLDDDDNEEEREEEVVVVPLADMLNARSGYDNVCFHLGCRIE